MPGIVKQAIEHWPSVSWLLKRPQSEVEFDRLVKSRDELLMMMGGDELHSLESLVSIISDHIEAYDRERRSSPIQNV
jgi:HTH-type transcriptional regulator/antitoxin HigA